MQEIHELAQRGSSDLHAILQSMLLSQLIAHLVDMTKTMLAE